MTDVELDGPWPGINSMRSFASVAVTADGVEHGRFEAVLEPLPGTAPDAATTAWFDPTRARGRRRPATPSRSSA